MRKIKVAQSDTKRRLIDAAEQLFAEMGFEVISVRDVTDQAGANVAAVNYHFGSRDGLIAMVVTRHITPVNEERLARLDLLEKKWPGKVIPVEEIIDAFVRPLLGTARKSELSERAHSRLLGRILSMQSEQLPDVVRSQIHDSNERFIRALGKAIPEVAPDDLAWRMHFVVGAMIHLLMNDGIPHRLSNGAAGSAAIESSLGRLIRFAAAGLCDGTEVAVEPEQLKGPQAVFDF